MNAARTAYDRQVDWSAVKNDPARQCQDRILDRMWNVGPRQSAAQLCGWLRGTPAAFVHDQLKWLVDIHVLEVEARQVEWFKIAYRAHYTQAPTVVEGKRIMDLLAAERRDFAALKKLEKQYPLVVTTIRTSGDMNAMRELRDLAREWERWTPEEMGEL